MSKARRRSGRASRRTCRRARAAATSSRRCAACARSSRAGRRRSPGFAVTGRQSAVRNPPVQQSAMVARDSRVGAGRGGAAVPRRIRRHREPRRALRPERPERADRLVEAGRGSARCVAWQHVRASRQRASASAPWRADLAALERQLKTEIPRVADVRAAPPATCADRPRRPMPTSCAASARWSRRARSGSSASSRCASPSCSATSTRSVRRIS